MPPWTHIHPLIVHFPIVLLLVMPLFVILGVLWPTQRRGIHFAALAGLALGVVSALLALASGNAASNLAQRTPELRAALAEHEHFAQLATGLFAVLTVLFGLLWSIPIFAPGSRVNRRLSVLHLLWLALSLFAMAALIQTGRLGGHMVHDLGTHARIGSTSSGEFP